MTKLEEAREVDRELKELARGRRVSDAVAAKKLLRMKRGKLYRALGYSRLQDYAWFELDMKRSKAKDLVEIAERVERLPLVARAFEAGELEWTKCRAVVRVATSENEGEWLGRARTVSSRALEREVARAKGERPRVRVVLELSEEDAADLDEAVRRLREERGEAVPLGEAVGELARRSMGPPVDRPGYQVVIHECPTCEKASRDASGGEIPVGERELEAARVDAEIVDLRERPARVRRSITPAERREVIARDSGRCALCGTRAWLHIHHVVRRSGDPSVLSLLCSACHKRLVHEGHVLMAGRAPRFAITLRDGTSHPRRR